MVKLLFFRFRVTNSKLRNKKMNFELLIQWVHFCFLTEAEKLKELLKYYSLDICEPIGKSAPISGISQRHQPRPRYCPYN